MIELEGGHIVRLKHDPDDDDLRAGDCGIVWGVYDFQPVIYEATFLNRQQQKVDLMFAESEVELLENFDDTPFPEHLREMRQTLADANEALREHPEVTECSVADLRNAVAFAQGILSQTEH